MRDAQEIIFDQFQALKYALGGNSLFTLEANGAHYSYKIKHEEGKPYFVKVLTNGQEPVYMGCIFEDKVEDQSFKIHTGGKSQFTPESKSVQCLEYALRTLTRKYDDQFTFWHHGTCGICGRELTDPESIELGIGPVCREKGI